MTDYWERDLVTLSGVKLLSRPDLAIRKINGLETPQHVGRGEFHIEVQEGEVLTVRVGSEYWDTAVSAFADIQTDRVNVTILPWRWVVGERAGTTFYFYSIEDAPIRSFPFCSNLPFT